MQSTGVGPVANSSAVYTEKASDDLPDDDRERRKAVFRDYVGKGKMPSDKKPKRMDMRVIYPPRNRIQDINDLYFPSSERKLDVSITFNEFVSQSITGANWDRLNGTLDGQEEKTGSGGTYKVYIRCDNFYFTNWEGPVNCTYRASNRSSIIEIEFPKAPK